MTTNGHGEQLARFNSNEIRIVNDAVQLAEELVGTHYKLSSTQLLNLNYDIKTLEDLSQNEIVADHFAQVIRYAIKKENDVLGTSVKDFYKICIQDHAVIKAVNQCPELDLFAFMLYIVAHELIHVIRFQTFRQHFDALCHEKNDEEVRVHQKTHEILSKHKFPALEPVLAFYAQWRSDTPDFENR